MMNNKFIGIGIFLCLALFFIPGAFAQESLHRTWFDARYGSVNVTPQGMGGSGGCGTYSDGSAWCDRYNYYLNITTVNLVASTTSGGKFLGWSGACSGIAPICQISVSGNVSVNAAFGPENSTNQTHLTCVNMACTTVQGPGNNTCSTNAQCQTNQTTHLTCMNNMCTSVNGAGNNTCSPIGSQCGVSNQTHLTCVNMACQMVSGPGNNTCSTDAQCGHNVCNYVNKTCSRVAGAGKNECDLGERCTNIKGKLNATLLSPNAVASFPQCNSWLERTLLNRRACKRIASGESA